MQRIVKGIGVTKLRTNKTFRLYEKRFLTQLYMEVFRMGTAELVKLPHGITGIIAAVHKTLVIVLV